MTKWATGFFLLLLLAACQPAETETPTLVQSVTEVISTMTSLPTATPTVTHTATAAPVQTQSPALTLAVQQTSEGAVAFISETVPDGTQLDPGEKFTKTWKIKNSGSQPWTSGYALLLVSASPAGETLGGKERIPLPAEVQAGETVEISVDLAAPLQDGRYTVTWQLSNARGEPLFGGELWVRVVVGDALASAPPPAGGVSAQLVGASWSVEMVTVDFCMQLPDSRAWYPWDVNLLLNERQFSPEGSWIDPVTATTPYKCFSFSYPVGGAAASGAAYQLSIGNVGLPPEVHQDENCTYAWQTLTAAYPGLDFTCSGPGLFYTNLVTPPGMSKEQADRLIMDAMSSTIYGPWVLSGTIP